MLNPDKHIHRPKRRHNQEIDMHPFTRRSFVRHSFVRTLLSCTAPVWLAAAPAATAQTFPSRPVTMVLGVATGGPTDVETRLYAKKMTELMGQTFLLDYKVGAGGAIAAGHVAKAPPDGHTLLVMAGSFTVLPVVFKNLPFDVIKDFSPISLMSEKPQILLANPSFPIKNFQEFIARARANPGKVNVGITNQGGINHLMNVWMHTLTGTQVTYVPYKGEGPLLPDLLGGRLDAAAIGIGTAIRLAKTGKVRALGTTMTTRPKVWPDLPTIAEQGVPQFNYTSWVGIGGPAGTPAAVINSLSENFIKTAKSPEVIAPLEADGWVLVGSGPAPLRQLVATETERWMKLVKDNNIVADAP